MTKEAINLQEEIEHLGEKSAWDINQKFEYATALIASMDNSASSSNDIKLKMYGNYKQAMVGNCCTKRPSGMFDFAGKAKWDAWNDLADSSKSKAKNNYVSLVLTELQTNKSYSEVQSERSSLNTLIEQNSANASESKQKLKM